MDEEDSNYHPVFRDGRVHVLSEQCSSCIGRSVNDGRIEGLQPGRVAGMVVEAREKDSVIPCHQTIYTEPEAPAVCRWYFDKQKYNVVGLGLAEAMGYVEFVDPPEDH